MTTNQRLAEARGLLATAVWAAANCAVSAFNAGNQESADKWAQHEADIRAWLAHDEEERDDG